MFIDGDLIATGTMRGDRLIAGTEIKAPLITGGKMVAGSVISAGNPPAFELLEDGTLNARRANISGNINASSGQLSNVLINENCYIKKLNVEQIDGDISKCYIVPSGGYIEIEASSYGRYLNVIPVVCAISTFPTFSAVELGGTIIVSTGKGRYARAYASVEIDGVKVIEINLNSNFNSQVRQESFVKYIPKGVRTTIKYSSFTTGDANTPSQLFIITNRA